MTTTPLSPILPTGEILAITQGYHTNPFAVLGAHPHSKTSMIIRTFQPQATSVFIKTANEEIEMKCIHEAGLYEQVIQCAHPTPYRLRINTPDGQASIQEDPYRFDYSKAAEDLIIYEKQGVHLAQVDGVEGAYFSIWAPNAERVSLIGQFNDWDGRRHPMRKQHDQGIWDIFIPHIEQGQLYKYEIKTHYKGYVTTKSDPVGFFHEMRPNTASIVWDINDYQWQDEAWINGGRAQAQSKTAPVSIYEVHLGSWRRKGEMGETWLTYRELADTLIPYASEMGFTHLELLPISEHPFDGSWGYQVTGYYAPTSRFGTPQDFMYFVDRCHQAGLGVILDWVPAHFPKDEHGLGFFDGTYLYEHEDPRQGEHPDWGTKIFNFGRKEVRDFLICNALFWIDKYHIDGLRVDAVASMLYLDFSREPGEWLPNRYGGRENIEAIQFLRDMNDAVHHNFPTALTFAEESTAWPGVTRATDDNGGLGFDVKWNMGWMNDTLRYIATDPIYRSFHQGTLTFSLHYAFSENYILPFSHDEVVHLKKSLVDKMPGDSWQKFANLRLLFAYQYAHPGRKLNFMGNEIAQWEEWQEHQSLPWHLLEQGEAHKGVQNLVKTLNHLYQAEPALHQSDDLAEGFEWIDFRDAMHSVLVFLRQTISPSGETEQVLVICNFTPELRRGYRIGVPQAGFYQELLTTDHAMYGGGGIVNDTDLEAAETPWQDRPYSIQIDLPPLGVIYLKRKEV